MKEHVLKQLTFEICKRASKKVLLPCSLLFAMGNQPGKEARDYGRKIDWKNAERPSSPGKPYLVPEEGNRLTDVITIRWSPPTTDGGAPLIGYLVEHRRTGSPHWLRAIPDLVIGTELPLTGLEPGWRYQFRVSAENEIGRSDPGELSEPLTVTPQKWAACAPFFNIELEDTIGLENEKVEFKVQVIAVPAATISWYKDGFEIFSSRRTKIITENDQSTFIIHQAALEDEGEIKCTATNRAGYSVTKANLKLEAPPRIRLPRPYEDGLIFEKGELIRLKVTTAGRPKPQIYWYHNGELLQKSNKFDVVDSEGSSMVKIVDACRDDRGEYVIKGVNKIGEDVASFLVTVTDRPSPPGKIQIIIQGRKVTLSWSSPEDDGGCEIGSYIIEYFRVGWDMWLKAKNSRQLSTVIDDLIEGSEYKFRVRAENPYGISEPSVESDVIFIPDPKRGILKPPPKKQILENLKETKPQKEFRDNIKTEENKNRKLLEEKARKLLDTPLSELLPYKSTEKTSEDENVPPPVPKRRNKGKGRTTPSPNLSDRSNVTPSPVNSLGSSQAFLIPQTLTPNTISEPVMTNGTIQSADWVSKSEELRRSGQLKFMEQDLHIKESPMHPRENDDSILHGSSELMLVIYPRDRSKSFELTAQQRSEIELSLKADGVPPPISLSAPELGCNEFLELPVMRNAVSSSEILYEKTTARLYQDSVEEESQRMVKRRYSMDRKSVERRASLKETLEKRLSFKEEIKPKEKSPEEESNDIQSMIHKPKILDNGRERLNSVERERLEFALVRERLKRKEEEGKLRVLNHDSSTSTMTATSSSAELEELDEDEYEEDEYLDEEEEEDYLDHNKKQEIKEKDIDFDKDVNYKKPISLPTPIKTAPYAQQEDDTYHPRSMIPTRSVYSKVEKPEINKSVETPLRPLIQPEVKIEEKSPSKIPVPSQTKSKKTSKLLKKFGLKKDKKIPIVMLTPADPTEPPSNVPKPILKNKIITKKKGSPKTLLKFGLNKSTDKSISEEESESELSGKKKKQVRIAEPAKEKTEDLKEEKLVDENAKENQVLIYHYSDIVKEFGAHKKPSARLYLNYDELKAHAKSEENTFNYVGQINTENKVNNVKITYEKEPDVAELIKTEVNQPVAGETKPKSSKPEVKLSRSFEYTTDVMMFILACWLYLFSNELYAIPVLCIMAYRQLKDMTIEKYKKINVFISNLIPDKLKRKTREKNE